MSRIESDRHKAQTQHFQLAVVGGGIHGTMLALEASLRGISTLLLDRDDFGGSTSYNSLRIIHGGFRYIQHFDFQRLIASARERQWFLRFFPNLVSPQACMMPLYGRVLKRPFLLKGALQLYQLLTEKLNNELPPDKKIPKGRIISPEETMKSSSSVIADGLKGGAVWYDAFMPHSQRLLIGALRWACDHGAFALNYCKATKLLTHKDHVVGVRAVDQESETEFEFRTDVVINAAGPWCREVATTFDRDVPRLFNTMVAWNVLFDRPAISEYAMAVSPPQSGSRAFFVVPWNGLIFAGTGQASRRGMRPTQEIGADEMDEFCRELNQALPGLDLRKGEIIHVYSGLQSAQQPGGSDLSHRDEYVDHSRIGGPHGLYSASGIKFTTARLMAERTVNTIFAHKKHRYDGVHASFYSPPKDISGTGMLFDHSWRPQTEDHDWRSSLRSVIDREAVHHLDDLVLRRSNLGENPERSLTMAEQLVELFDWQKERQNEELQRLQKAFPFVAN